MGTGKKLLLASLVSMSMVLAFLIGLVPSHDTESTGAAGVQSERVDMVVLLDKMLGYGAKQGGAITLESRIAGVVVKTPEDNADLANLQIPVPVQATVDGDGSELVTFVANLTEDPTAFPEPGSWVGDVFTEPVSFPFFNAIDVSPFVADMAVNSSSAIAIYALTNAVEATKATALFYENSNLPADALDLTIYKTVGTVDNDNNGMPDNPFDAIDGIQPGEIWVSNVVIDGVLRTVMVANLDPGSKALGDIYVSPNGNVTVESPTLQDFVDAGLIPAGESGLLIVETVNDLAGLLDEVDGVASEAARQAWADGVNEAAPGVLTGMGQFVEISLVYTLYSGTAFDELEDMTGSGLGVTLTMAGLEPGLAPPQLWSYSTMIAENGGDLLMANDPAAEAWKLIPEAQAAGTAISATVETLSVFAPFDSALSLTGAAPAQIPQGYPVDVTLTGVIPTSMALNVAEAAAAYSVLFNGEAGTFRLGPAKQADAAITAFDGVNENTLYITAPALSALGSVDVQIIDLNNPGNQSTTTALMEVIGTATVTTSVTGSATATVALSPANGLALPAGTYMLGDSVDATVTFGAAETFDGWLLNGTDVGTANPLNFSVDGPTTLVAQISAAGVALNLSAGTGGSVAADPLPDLAGDLYTPNTVVTLTATPAGGYAFAGWTGADAADLTIVSDGVATITMDADKEIVANFSVSVTWALTLNAYPALGGSAVAVTPPNAGAEYLDGTVVTIQATPTDATWIFVNWTGPSVADLNDPNAAETTITMDADKQVTANFRQKLTITEIDPAEAWIFGGVVATIKGTGLTNDTLLTLDGVAMQGFRAAADNTSVEVVIPAYTGASTAATADVELIGDDEFNDPTDAITFAYKRHEAKDGVNTTAFILDNPAVENTVDVTLDGSENDVSPLVLPALDTTADMIYGIARNSLIAPEASKNTPVIGALGTGYIDYAVAEGDAPAGSAIEGAYDFSLHLYAADAAKNTPAAGSGVLGAAASSTGEPLLTLARGEDSEGNPLPGSPALWTFPLDASGITYGDVRDGLTMWGVGTAYDYASDTTTVIAPATVAYQSEIQVNEVDPAITDATTPADTASPDLIVEARLYSLNGFSLRSGALLSDEMMEGIRLATDSGTANGPLAGGTAIRIISPLGGIAWVDRIEFVTVAKAIAATATSDDFVTVPGTNEYILDITTPEASQSGIMDMVIYLKADNTVPAVTLERAFEYKRTGKPLDAIFLILLGLLIAIIGLLAGGDSGGGGGGPCFIATAAYGTPLAGDIDTLRAVRDTYLLDNAVGTAFVDSYYQVSPMIADVVATHPMLAALVRVLLVPVIFLGKVALAMPVLTALVGLSLGAAFMLRRRARGRA